jgi:hypothetical protein
MKRSPFCYLLLFLVLSAFADDAWAAITAESADDALTAENNEYLLVRPSAPSSPRLANDLPLFPAAADSLAPASPTGSGTRHVPGRDASLDARSLLYLFMSLRR